MREDRDGSWMRVWDLAQGETAGPSPTTGVMDMDSSGPVAGGEGASSSIAQNCCKPGPLPIGRSLIPRACRQDILHRSDLMG